MTSAWLLIRRLADQLAIYLPVLLMGALALGSLALDTEAQGNFCVGQRARIRLFAIDYDPKNPIDMRFGVFKNA